jgi:hypothetical protein
MYCSREYDIHISYIRGHTVSQYCMPYDLHRYEPVVLVVPVPGTLKTERTIYCILSTVSYSSLIAITVRTASSTSTVSRSCTCPEVIAEAKLSWFDLERFHGCQVKVSLTVKQAGTWLSQQIHFKLSPCCVTTSLVRPQRMVLHTTRRR